MNKKWYDDWKVTVFGNGKRVLELPNSHTNTEIVFVDKEGTSVMTALLDVADCALTELTNKKE